MNQLLQSVLSRFRRSNTEMAPSHLLDIEIVPATSIHCHLHVRMPGTEDAAIAFLFRGGVAHDIAEGGQPIGPFAASTLFEANSAIVDELAAAGGGVSLSPDEEWISGALMAPLASLDAAVGPAARLISAPLFPQDRLEAVSQDLLARLTEANGGPLDRAQTLFAEAFCQPHPYVDAIVPQAARTRAPSRDDAVRWHRQRFTRGGLTAVTAGDFDSRRGAQLLEQFAEHLGDARVVPDLPPLHLKSPAREPIRVEDQTQAQAVLVTGWQGTPSKDAKVQLASSMLMDAIAGGEQSRAFKHLRDRLGLTYGLQATGYSLEQVRINALIGQVEKSRAIEAANEIASLLEEVRLNGITSGEVSHLQQSYIQGRQAMARSAPAAARHIQMFLAGHADPQTIVAVGQANPAEIDPAIALPQTFAGPPITAIVG